MIPSSKHVFNWPEWKAFAKRIGVPEVPTYGLKIELNFKELVKVTHEYYGQDSKDEKPNE